MTHIDKDKLGIIIILYNPDGGELDNVRHISSLYNGVIVDNSPHRNFAGPSVNRMAYIALCRNAGIAEAQNVGLRHVLATGVSHVIYFDQDSLFGDDYPLKIAAEYEHLKSQGVNLAALGPTVVQKETGETYRSVIHKDKVVNSHFILRKEVIASGCCIGAGVFGSVGYNDESLFIDFVDCEWCWRAYGKGYVCGITPDITIYHKVGRREMHIGRHIIIISAPFRYYYQYRNLLLLMPRGYVPLQWKANKAVKFALRLVYFPLAVKGGLECWRYMLKGISSGIRKLVTGK